uniref:BPTI/Kunitz inhibitor domain-containing protein n=1 Tax=Salvator merianae TaxID=96440 RepID=A0A8D0E7R9_SALMN
ISVTCLKDQLATLCGSVCGSCIVLQLMSEAPENTCGIFCRNGECNKYTLRWYYNQRVSKCRPFIYSGCKGNLNRFDSKEDCEHHCVRVCALVCVSLPLYVCAYVWEKQIARAWAAAAGAERWCYSFFF